MDDDTAARTEQPLSPNPTQPQHQHPPPSGADGSPAVTVAANPLALAAEGSLTSQIESLQAQMAAQEVTLSRLSTAVAEMHQAITARPRTGSPPRPRGTYGEALRGAGGAGVQELPNFD